MRFEARSLLGCGSLRNAPVRAFNRRRSPNRQTYVEANTELLIDGFQGSANTFAVRSFLAAQSQPRVLAKKTHTPEQVGAAVRRSIPVLLTLREPFGAVRSTIRRWPGVSPSTALRGYVRYYEAVAPYQDDVFIAEFSAVTSDFDAVTVAFNERFDTTFDVAPDDLDPATLRQNAGTKVVAAGRDEAEARLLAGASDSALSAAKGAYDRLLQTAMTADVNQ